MTRTTGFAITLAVTVAAVGMSGTPAPTSAPTMSLKVASPMRAQLTPLLPKLSANGCSAFEPVSKDIDRYPHPADDNRGEATAVLSRFFGVNPPTDAKEYVARLKEHLDKVRFVLAVVPDPVHTHLSLMFDRQITSIQQAAEDIDYSYNSSWLPWKKDVKNYEKLADDQYETKLTEEREMCPGLLLFRRRNPAIAGDSGKPETNSTKSKGKPNNPKNQAKPRLSTGPEFDQGLIVLLVGEQPTGGISQEQWNSALSWLSQFSQSKVSELSVLGPTFSGSLASLERNIQNAQAVNKDWHPVVASGTVSSSSLVSQFKNDLAKAGAQVQLELFQENDDLQIYRLLRYLKRQGTKCRQVSIISEDETGYGEESGFTQSNCPDLKDPYDRPVRLYYPRDISALRAAYQKESIFVHPVQSQEGHTIRTILKENTESEAPGESSDTVRNYSGAITPLSQEASLYGIVGELRSHHARYLILRCTNPLDFVFLTRFFQRSYPEGHIVIVGQDMLFQREIDSTEFRGVMALSNYPLLPRGTHWTALTKNGVPLDDSHHVFESHLAEGLYLAARYLFSRQQEPASIQRSTGATSTGASAIAISGDLGDYADPFWLGKPLEQTGPPTWLAVVGRQGYWPVAVLNDRSFAEEKTEKSDWPIVASTLVQVHTESRFHIKDNKVNFPLAWKVAVACAFLLLLYQIYGVCPWPNRNFPSSGPFAPFRPPATPNQQILQGKDFPSKSPAQEILLGTNCALAILILLELVVPLRILHDFSIPSEVIWVRISCGAALLLPLLMLILLLLRNQWFAALAYSVVVLGSTIGGFLVLHNSLKPYNADAVPSLYRMTHLTSGVSPTLPFLLLTGGLYLWTWHSMAGNIVLCNGRPLLPKCHLPNLSPPTDWLLWLLSIGELEASVWNELPEELYRLGEPIDQEITKLASPVYLGWVILGPILCLGLSGIFLFYNDLPVLGSEGEPFSQAINLLLLFAFLLTIGEVSRLFWTWFTLRRVLTALARTRLKRTFAKLKPLSSASLWSVSGKVQRVQYGLFSQQMDAVRRLRELNGVRFNLWSVETTRECGEQFSADTAPQLTRGPKWDKPVVRPSDQGNYLIRAVFANTVAEVTKEVLLQHWSNEKDSLSLDSDSSPIDCKKKKYDMKLSCDETVRTAEEFVCFQYISFIQNILARMRTITLSVIALFVAECFTIAFYPFVPRTQITLWMLINLAIITVGTIYVYAGMERDEILSYITDTEPGELGTEFWFKAAAFLTGPVIGILTTQFPTIADSVLGWLQPGLNALH